MTIRSQNFTLKSMDHKKKVADMAYGVINVHVGHPSRVKYAICEQVTRFIPLTTLRSRFSSTKR